MATMTTGVVRQVDVNKLGSQLLADAPSGTSVLTLDTAAPFSPTGGSLTLDDVIAAYVSADAEAGTITLADPLDATLEAGFPVWQMAGNEIDVTYWATVDLDDPDARPISARVPTLIRGWLSPERDYTTPVSVTLRLDAGAWEVVDPNQAAALDAPVRLSDEEGNVAGGVDQKGNVSAADLSYTGTFIGSAASMVVDGETLEAHRASLPRRVVAFGSRIPSVTGIGASEYGVMEFAMPAIPDAGDRLYRFTCRAAARPQGTLTAPLLRVRLRASTAPAGTTPAAPTITSPEFGAGSLPMAAQSVSQSPILNNSVALASDTEYRFLVTYAAQLGMTSVDAEFTVSAFIEDLGPKPGNSAVQNSGGGVLATGGSDTGDAGTVVPQTYAKTYDATDTKWWSGQSVFGGAGDSQYFGDFGNDVGNNRKSVIWFDKSQISKDLNGATLTKVELYLYLHNGGQDNNVAVGRHTDTTPASNNYDDVLGVSRELQTFGNWDEGTGKWVTLTDPLLTNWTGNLAGYVIGPLSSLANSYAGAFRGATHSQGPRLRLTYSI